MIVALFYLAKDLNVVLPISYMNNFCYKTKIGFDA